MPTYEYSCSTCGKNFEATQRMSEAALTTCLCGENGVVSRQISAGNGLIFKGSGFYITDYKNGGAKGGDSKPAASEAPAKTAESTSSAAAAPACGAGACPACTDS